jgi:Rad3-related DNA helicase
VPAQRGAGGFIGPRLKAARSSVLFSATLSPRRYYADLLGTPADTVWIDVESPFSAEQLQVQIVSRFPRASSSAGVAGADRRADRSPVQ